MKWIGLLVLLLAACGRSEPPAAPPEPTPEPISEGTPALIQYDEDGRRLSRGFKTNVPRKLEPLTEEEQAKQARIEAAERAARQIPLSPEQSARRTHVAGELVWAFDLYRDGTLLRREPATGMETPIALTDVVVAADLAGVRSVLAHGSSGSRWLSIDDLDTLQLRVNRQGRLKLEAKGRRGRRLGGGKGSGGGSGMGTGGGAGDGKGKRTGKQRGNKRRFREQEIQGLYWLELSTAAAPQPRNPSEDDPDQHSTPASE